VRGERYTTLWPVFAPLLLAGCVSANFSAIRRGNPASTQAAEAPMTVPSRTLASYIPASATSAAEPETATDQMQDMPQMGKMKDAQPQPENAP